MDQDQPATVTVRNRHRSARVAGIEPGQVGEVSPETAAAYPWALHPPEEGRLVVVPLTVPSRGRK